MADPALEKLSLNFGLNPYNFRKGCDLQRDPDIQRDPAEGGLCAVSGTACNCEDYHNCRTRQKYHKDHRCA